MFGYVEFGEWGVRFFRFCGFDLICVCDVLDLWRAGFNSISPPSKGLTSSQSKTSECWRGLQQQTENMFPLIFCEIFLVEIAFPGIPRSGHNFFLTAPSKKMSAVKADKNNFDGAVKKNVGVTQKNVAVTKSLSRRFQKCHQKQPP